MRNPSLQPTANGVPPLSAAELKRSPDKQER